MDLSVIQDPPKPFSRGQIKTPHWGEVAPRDRKHRGKWELGAKGQGGLLFSSAFVPPPPFAPKVQAAQACSGPRTRRYNGLEQQRVEFRS